MLLAQLVVFILIVQIIIRPVMAAFLFTRPLRRRVIARTSMGWGADYRDVTFDGAGGVKLEGWYRPSRNGAAIILLHGQGGNRLSVASQAETLAREGYGVLLFDLRAHGSSGGSRFVLGEEPVNDVLAAVRLLTRQPEVQPDLIGVMGVSVGGMLAIQAAARTTAMRAVVAINPVVGAVEDLPSPAGFVDQFWRFPLERLYQAAISWFSRSPRSPSNGAALARIAGRPTLIISTGRGMDQRLARHLFEAAIEPKQWWQIPRAHALAGWVAGPEAYAPTLTDFFDRALSPHPIGGSPSGHEVDREDAAITSPMPKPLEKPAQGGGIALRPIAEHTVRQSTAMMIALATIPVAMLALVTPFTLRWGLATPPLPEGWEVPALLGILGLLMAGLLLHEWLHLAGYHLFGRVPVGAARLVLGRNMPAPQVYCDQPVSAGAYRRVLALPGLILGVLPGLIAVMVGSWILLLWSIWLVVAAGGDIAALWAMRGVPADTPVRAHPTRIGCQIIAH